jgi:flagellar basal body-associated protein FliL
MKMSKKTLKVLQIIVLILGIIAISGYCFSPGRKEE